MKSNTLTLVGRSVSLALVGALILHSTPRSALADGKPIGQVAEVSASLRARQAGNPGGHAPVWVFFRDRGFGSQQAERRALEALPDRSRNWRAARRHAPTVSDLPLSRRYLAALEELGARIRHESRWLNAASVELPLDRVDDLASLPFVRRLEPVRQHWRPIPESGGHMLDAGLAPEWADGVVGAARDSNLQLPGPSAELAPLTSYPAEELLHYGASFNQSSQIGVIDMHRRGYTGAGVRVLILDTGFRTDHRATAGRRLVAQHDFVFNDGNVNNEPADVSSAWSHGTGVWSNLGGFDPGALVGAAYESEILLAKTEDIRSELPVEEDNFVAALEWADTLGVDVASASLSYLTFDNSTGYTYADLNGDTAVTTIACDLAVQRGIAVVLANGNAGPAVGTLGAPADADSVIAVGAVDSLGVLAGFSSRGPTSDGRIKPEVTARGRSNYTAVASSNGYGPASGTSFATPLVGGVAALLLEAHPGWSGYDVRQALTSTASHPLSPDNNSGYGLVNARLAADSAPRTPPLVSLPFALIAPSRGVTVMTASPTLRWERSLPGGPGDAITYTVTLATNAAFTGATDYAAAGDTTWTAPFFLTPGATYYWRVTARNMAGWERRSYMPSRFTVSGTADVVAAPVTPAVPVVRTATPNPFSATTEIVLALPGVAPGQLQAAYRLSIFSAEGRSVRVLREATLGPAAREDAIRWDGSDDAGRPVAAGVYFVSLEAEGRRSTMKLIVQR